MSNRFVLDQPARTNISHNQRYTQQIGRNNQHMVGNTQQIGRNNQQYTIQQNSELMRIQINQARADRVFESPS